ncbi:MAG: hypothetical protein RMM08_01785 [Armatimonadota bacterium]|nr:hypothetical protein [Armatimonadota bacterium]
MTFYSERGLLERIDASGEVDEVYQVVKAAVSRRWRQCLAGE